MVDVFEEVEEQIRSDRYRALALKILPWFIGAVVLVLVAVGGWQGYRAWIGSQSQCSFSRRLRCDDRRQQRWWNRFE